MHRTDAQLQLLKPVCVCVCVMQLLQTEPGSEAEGAQQDGGQQVTRSVLHK